MSTTEWWIPKARENSVSFKFWRCEVAKLKKLVSRCSVFALLLLSPLVCGVGCSPKVVTKMREQYDEVSLKLQRLDEKGMTEMLEEQKAELSRAVRQVETELELISAHDRVLGAELRSELRALTNEVESLIAAREGDLLEMRRVVLAAVKRSHRREDEVAHRDRLRRFSERNALEVRVSESEVRVAQNSTRRLVGDLVTGLAHNDWSEVRRLFTPDAQEELSERRLAKLRESVPSEPQITVTKLSNEISVAILAGRDGKQATLRLVTRQGATSIDDLILPLTL
jgi:hypothetical protein